LSNRITTLQKEMNPQVNVSGTTLTSSKLQYVTRKYGAIVKLASGVFAVKANTNSLPQGCKILKVVAKNLSGRSLTVTIPSDTAMMLPNATGAAVDSNAFAGTKRYVTAPLSRFPKITIQVPDLLAAPIDSGGASDDLFTVGSLESTATDTVELTYTVRYAL